MSRVNLPLMAAYEALRDKPAGADVRLTASEAEALYRYLRWLRSALATVSASLERLESLEEPGGG